MKTIGVDLGTTNSCVYYLDDDGQPVLVTDSRQRKIFPSVIYRANPEGEIVVGHSAKSRLGHIPAPIVAAKRKMGTTETLELGGEAVSVIDISAHILGYAKELVETTTGDQVGAAVVTVPAYFDAAPRKDTHEAAVRTFFAGDAEAAKGRIELQLEPEAAAFAYTLEDPTERLRLLVYDLGGGTFDVTILDKAPDSGLTELKFGGDPHLGGENVDDRIASWFLYLLRGGKSEALERLFLRDHYPEEERYSLLLLLLANDHEQLRAHLRLEDHDLIIGEPPRFALEFEPANSEDTARIQILKMVAEAAKKDLTFQSDVSVQKQYAFEDQKGELVDIDFTLSRAEFNLLFGDLVQRTLEETLRVLKGADMGVEDVDRVLLVGGSTRMPIIAEELAKIFSCPVSTKDPDLIVARGAALRARDLGVVITDASGERQLDLEYPRETPQRQVSIKGSLARPASDLQVYLSRDDREIVDKEVEGENFLLSEIQLLPEAENVFQLEIADPDHVIYAEAEIRIRHTSEAVVSPGSISTKITKPIQSLGVGSSRHIELFKEGTVLPTTDTFVCYRATHDDFIKIPFFEGDRLLGDLVISDISPDLPSNAAIDVEIELRKDYTGMSSAKVRSTGQSQQVDFEIKAVDIPALESMAEECGDVFDQINNDLELVRNRNARAQLARRAKQLRGEYQRADQELDKDSHKLFATIGELRKVLLEVRGAQVFLEPPLEGFEKLLVDCRGLLGQVGDKVPADTVERIAAHDRAGHEAWANEDAETWASVNQELRKLHDQLEQAGQQPVDPSQFSPGDIQQYLLAAIERLRGQIAEAGLEAKFGPRLRQIESSALNVDMHSSPDYARSSLIRIIQQQLAPLENEVRRTIEGATGNKMPTSDLSNVRWKNAR